MISVGVALVMIHVAVPRLPEASARRYATDIAAVAETREDAAIYVTTGKFESDMRASVESCETTGDNGDAVSIYQLQRYHWGTHTREEICRSNLLATRLMAGAVGRLRRIKGSVELMFMAYLGAKHVDNPKVRDRMQMFNRLMEDGTDA